MRYGLKDGSLSVVTNLGDKTIEDVSSFLENRLLIAESASINRKRVRRISWVDVNTGQTGALYAGILARYLEGPGIVVYDDRERLFAVPLAGLADIETVFTHKTNQVSTMLVVSEDTVLFETRGTDGWLIRSYNASTRELQRLERLSGVCRLAQAVWITDLEQLACKQRQEQSNPARYVFTNLEGDVIGAPALPEGKRFDALTYIDGQNALILKERWNSAFGGQERSAIWAYNTRSRESFRLADDQNLGSAVVYMDF
jgi:hypothetical protein